jgi:Iron-sulfur cluster assembly protein
MSETAAPDDALLADIEEAMRDVVDPELGINVVDLGLVYDMNVEKGEQGNVALRHDAHLGGLSAHRCHRGSVAHCADRQRARQRSEDQLGVEPAVGSGQDHRGRPRAVAGPRIHRLIARLAVSVALSAAVGVFLRQLI